MARNEKFILKSGTLSKKEESNEITKSLRMFAEMTEQQDFFDFRTPIKFIKRDFESNGVNVDDNNRDDNNLRDRKDLISPVREKDSYGISKETMKAPKKKSANANSQFCVFCENNKEPHSMVRSHAVRDMLGRVMCPKLRSYKCPVCNAFGDNAHTIKYCPKRPIITMEDTILLQRLGNRYPLSNIISILNF